MAQRTGPERFLGADAKIASAGALPLALAIAALLLTGCGGDSSESETAAVTTSSTAGSGKEDAARVPATSAEAKAHLKVRAAGERAEQQDADTLSAQGQKQGKHIVQPEGTPEQAPTPAEISHATVADMTLESPAIVASGGEPGSLSPTYTCDGKDSWPTLHWSGVPAGTAELALFVMNVQPVQGQLFVDWAVAGLKPDLTEIKAGTLPKGAIVGTNSFGKRGYQVCPSRGEIYMFAVYALPRGLAPKEGFDARDLRREILAVSGNVGLLPTLYVRS